MQLTAKKIMTISTFLLRIVDVSGSSSSSFATTFLKGRTLARATAAAFCSVRPSRIVRRPLSMELHRSTLTSPSSSSAAADASTTSTVGEPLPSSQLRWKCDPDQFDFKTTAELEDFKGTLLGQARAESAIEFGVNMKCDGYNLYVLGPTGSGKRTVIRNYLDRRSLDEPPASDWAYVHNFDDPDRPKALKLPAGLGQCLAKDLIQLIEDIQVAIPAALESDEHRLRLQQAERQVFQEHERDFQQLKKDAGDRDLMLIRTPTGLVLGGPASGSRTGNNSIEQQIGGEPSTPSESKPMSPAEEQALKDAIEELQPQLEELIQSYPRLKKSAIERVKQLNKEAARNAIEYLFAPLKTRYADLPDVIAHLDAVEANVIERSEDIHSEAEEEDNLMTSLLRRKRPVSFDLYKINLLVDNNETMATGAPVIYEDYPTLGNLIGRVEHVSQLGAFITDFSLIKAGSLHRANGGYLVVHARDVLIQPFSWEALKRALRLGEIKIESLGAEYSLISTVSLQPEPIKLDVKVALLGDRLLYYMLQMYDPDFDDLFKVAADFNDEMDRSPEACRLYARMLGTLAENEDLKPMDPHAVAAMIEQAARQVGDQEKLSTHMRSCADLLRESDYWTGVDGADVIGSQHVRKAIDQQIYRADRIRELVYEEIRRGTLLVDVKGSRVGQVNGLSVHLLGSMAFGRPSRITATARMGRGKVVDIEREVELGGATHSKGVMILSSVLSSRYALDRPLCLSASLVFEQSYGPVEGDSASMAELCALLSVLSKVPIRQGLAITGSVNQLGEAQAIGGAIEKIEGFYDVCSAIGLTGDQGVLIPASNVKHLMLRPDVLEAVDEGKFNVYTYNNVDEAVKILTGVEAGERDADGNYPPDTVNFLVDKYLHELAELVRDFSEDSSDAEDE